MTGSWLFFVLVLVFVNARPVYDDHNFPQVDPDRYIVKFAGDAALGMSEIQGLDGHLLLDLPMINGAAVYLPPSAVQRLENSSHIEFIEHDVPRWPMSKSASGPQVVPYGIPMVQATQDQLPEGEQHSWVCIIDSGIDGSHEDLQGIPNLAGDAPGWNTDKCGHGTHVAGTVVARDNTIGVIGVSQSVSVFVVKVFGDTCAWTYASNLIAAAGNCTLAGRTQVTISMSLGCSANVDLLCKSTAEEQYFQKLYSEGHISVAAAGNAGNTQNSWPASYESVISVAAVDSTGKQASFSQSNVYVEIAAPGVAVESTYPMGMGESTTFIVSDIVYTADGLDGSPYGTASGPLVNCGLGTSVCSGVVGAVCLIQRGNNSFSDKVLNCQNGGGIGVVIYNNVPGTFLGTLNGVATLIPSASLSQEDGQTLAAGAGGGAFLEIQVDNYAFLDGTSMATPHVSGVIAKVWSHNKNWSNDQLRKTMQNTATPCNGQTGKNNQCGWGLIQGQAFLNNMKSTYV